MIGLARITEAFAMVGCDHDHQLVQQPAQAKLAEESRQLLVDLEQLLLVERLVDDRRVGALLPRELRPLARRVRSVGIEEVAQ